MTPEEEFEEWWEKEYLTVDQTAQYLQIPKSVVYSKWRLLGGAKIGRHIRIPREGIDDYLAGQRQMVCQGHEGGGNVSCREGVCQEGRCATSTVVTKGYIKEYKAAARHLSRKLLKSVGAVS